MFSKEESKKLREEFWTSFGKSFPTKWILYNTKVKGLALKFSFGLRNAMVSIDIDSNDLSRRIELWDKLLALKSILVSEYCENVKYCDTYLLDDKKEISRIYVLKESVSIHNKESWRDTMEFFQNEMSQLERFFKEYKEYLSN
nr:DUF4268 domain-containing protein [Eudoraea chungangensis]